MPTIILQTEIDSTLEICFDLSRSIDLHRISTAHTKEEAIAGVTTGLIGLNETVTWQATHFGIRQKLTSKITAFDRPYHFRDEQLQGIFKSIYHDHHFKLSNGKVLMTDIFTFETPYGLLGKLFSKLVLTAYLRKFLVERNEVIKRFAEEETERKLREVV
jgi:ligand-binding SRPBCC domain-containing protein